jgi:hypothetical protein
MSSGDSFQHYVRKFDGVRSVSTLLSVMGGACSTRKDYDKYIDINEKAYTEDITW